MREAHALRVEITQAEVQALRDQCEELADDVRTLSALVHALRRAMVEVGVVKGGV
jgi:hypothetical protein